MTNILMPSLMNIGQRNGAVKIVIAGLVPVIHGSAGGIHQDNSTLVDGWIAATSAAITVLRERAELKS